MQRTLCFLGGEHRFSKTGALMRRILLILAITSVSTLLFSACTQPGTGNTATNANVPNGAIANTNTAASSAAAEADIRRLMDTAAAALARNDADAMDKIYGENYMLVNLDGSVENRAQRLNSLRTGDAKYTAFSYDEINIRVNPEGTGAVAIARANIKGTMRGKPIDAYYRVTQVYSKMKDGWRQVSAQATAITGVGTSPGTELPTPTSPARGLPTPTGPAGGLPTPSPGATSNANR
jgi:ketosteroid isomerase-like protein